MAVLVVRIAYARVPEDELAGGMAAFGMALLYLLAFGGLAMAHSGKLTCLRLPRLEIGRRSAEALLARVRGNPEKVRLDLGFEVIQREST